MNKSGIKIKICYYGDIGDPVPPNEYRTEIVIGGVSFIPDHRQYEHDGCMPKKKAKAIAEKVSRILGVPINE